MQVTAKLNNLRMSGKKVRLLVDLVRGRNARKALELLSFSDKAAARPVKKLIESAIANAKHNSSATEEMLAKLRIAKIIANNGPALKRWMPKAHGSATPIRKGTCHILVVLSDERPWIKPKKDKESAKSVKSEPVKKAKK